MFPLHFPYRASPCTIRFQLDSASVFVEMSARWFGNGAGVIEESSADRKIHFCCCCVSIVIIVVVFGAVTLLRPALTNMAGNSRLFPVVLASLITFSPLPIVPSQFFSGVVSVLTFPGTIFGIHGKHFSLLGFVGLKTYPQPVGTGRSDRGLRWSYPHSVVTTRV